MENIKEILRENLVAFRKENKLTQLELAEKVHFSDKSISRWETGEVVPDIETINLLAELYNIPLEYFFKKNEKKVATSIKLKTLQVGNKSAIALLTISTIWLFATIIYSYLDTFLDFNYWMCFIWSIPITFLCASYFTKKWGSNLFTCIFNSVSMWTLLLALYLHFINYNIYLIFIIGAPLQVIIVLWSYIKSGEKSKNE